MTPIEVIGLVALISGVVGMGIGAGVLACMRDSRSNTDAYKWGKRFNYTEAMVLGAFWYVTALMFIIIGIRGLVFKVKYGFDDGYTQSTLSRKQQRTLEYEQQRLELQERALETQHKYLQLVAPEAVQNTNTMV